MGSLTPRPAAVPGMSWVRPTAPAPERALALKPDSCLIRPASSAGSMPLRFADAVIRSPKGVPAGSDDAPVAEAPVGDPPVAEAPVVLSSGVAEASVAVVAVAALVGEAVAVPAEASVAA